MSEFARLLAERQTDPARRRWLFVPYDQLSDQIGPLAREDPRALGIILIENPWKAARRPYHKQKLGIILANLRHFALEQAERGVAVRHVVARRGPYRMTLEPLARDLGPIRVMEPAERELRVDLAELIKRGSLEVLPHEGWLTGPADLAASHPGRDLGPWRMDAFYRHVRRRTGILMEQGGRGSATRPVGGKFSFDVENRKPWRGEPPAPTPPSFALDPVKEEVGTLIERHFARHPGRLDMDSLPARQADAEKVWRFALRECLPQFGPFEDAMSTVSSGLFHTRISALVNLHRLLPARVIADALAADIPLASKEGFVRQVLGWREFVRLVHCATDGFRRLPPGVGVEPVPGDGGFERWSGVTWEKKGGPRDPDGGADPSFFDAQRPLPPAYWGKPSGLACLDRVVADVWREGYSHHITRLMVLSNLATLLDIRPRELADWFWVAYTDAFDWVVEPNVLAMGTHAVGDLMTTKPYIAGSAYIDRMSDYCSGCSFDPKRNCPITRLYWAFLARHRDQLSDNIRLAMPLRSLERRAAAQRREDERIHRLVTDSLDRGKPLSPESLANG